MAKHQFLVECECDGRFASNLGQADFQARVAGRVWTMDGVKANTACVKIVDKDVVVISRSEYEQMKATIAHLEK